MKYGINLLLWGANIGEPHYPLLEKLKSWGFDGVEIPMFGPDVPRYKKLGAKLKRHRPGVYDLRDRLQGNQPPRPQPRRPAGGGGLPQAADRPEQGRRLQAADGPVQLARRRPWSAAGRTDDEWKRAVEVFQKVAPYARQAGMPMALEYLNRFEHYFINDTATAARFVDEVNEPGFQLHYDTFHANIEEKKIPDAIRAGGKRIIHVHISENDRSTPGEGHVHWDETFQTLAEIGYDGCLMIEAFGAPCPRSPAPPASGAACSPTKNTSPATGWRS